MLFIRGAWTVMGGKYEVSAHNYGEVFLSMDEITNSFVRAVWLFFKAVRKYDHAAFEVRK